MPKVGGSGRRRRGGSLHGPPPLPGGSAGGSSPPLGPHGPLLSANRARARAPNPGNMFMIPIYRKRAGRKTVARWSKSLLWARPWLTTNCLPTCSTRIPTPSRIRSRKLKGNIAALVVDATGLGPDERAALEQRLSAAALAIPGVAEVRIALTASPARTQGDRRRQRQGRGRQVDAGGQPRHRAGPAGQEGRADRRRHLWPVAADPARRPRAAAAEKQTIDPGRGARRAVPVARAAGPGRAGAGLARADGDGAR